MLNANESISGLSDSLQCQATVSFVGLADQASHAFHSTNNLLGMR